MTRSNKLILGTVQFGLNYGINNSNGKISSKDVEDILAYARLKGIDTLDTASGYGDAEEKIGNYNANNDPYQVITKFDKTSGIDWEDSIRLSLAKLNIPIVEVAMFHSFSEYFKSKPFLNEMVERGSGKYFKHLGVSVYTNDELKELLEEKNVKVIQVPFNLLDNENVRRDILFKLKQRDKIIHARSIFLQGLFYKSLDDLPKVLWSLKPHLTFIHHLCNDENIDIGTLAMQYVCSKEYIDRVLIGVDNKAQLSKNIEATDMNIPQEILAKIDTIKVSYKSLLNPSTWNITK